MFFQITVKFARQETEVAKKAREKSYETMTQRIADEPWFDALWRPSDSDQSEVKEKSQFCSQYSQTKTIRWVIKCCNCILFCSQLERLKLFSATTSDGSALTLPAREYIRFLVPPPPPDEAGTVSTKILSLSDQIKDLFLRGMRIMCVIIYTS